MLSECSSIYSIHTYENKNKIISKELCIAFVSPGLLTLMRWRNHATSLLTLLGSDNAYRRFVIDSNENRENFEKHQNADYHEK